MVQKNGAVVPVKVRHGVTRLSRLGAHYRTACAVAARTRSLSVCALELPSLRAFQVWNPTVANLTLMALGSSAPEILLSVIEIVGNGFFSGDLGPSTIVGSAAFNLLIIVAVSVAWGE